MIFDFFSHFKKTSAKTIDPGSWEQLTVLRQIVSSMAELIETRSGGDGRHVKLTSGFVWILARAARDAGYHKKELTDEVIERMVICSVLHDVGKILVPDAILNKPGKLTDEEFEIMKDHTLMGGQIAAEIMAGQDASYQKMAREIATFHHEKWNGMGYPTGAAGEDIPLCARIMAIVDVFDALVSPRVYKEVMDPGTALNIIRSDGGTHFDPTLSELFYQKKTDILALIQDVR